MVIDFSKIKEPILILRTNDGSTVGSLGFAFDVVIEACYNEISKLSFNIPAYVGQTETPFYNEVIGMRIVDLKDVGQFILTDPKIQGDGVKEIKTCTAYSLEYEFTYKKITLENDTYNFWNPVVRSGSVLGIILEKTPSWSIGTVSSDLVGKYRTFDISNENLYNLIKSTIQETYQCVFEFDTYARKINIRSVKSNVATEPVYISFDNLVKNIEIAEDSKNIVTCLSVYGADGVDIRSVNPMGTNKIYDLSYFINPTNFTQQIINKYNSWKSTFESYQLPYYNLSVESALKTSELLTEQAVLAELDGDLKNLENQQAVIIQAIAQKLKTQSALNDINRQITAKSAEITAKQNVITEISSQISSIKSQMKTINKTTDFSAFFTPSELIMLDRYIKEDSLEDSSFVASSVDNYNVDGTSSISTNSLYSIAGSNVTRVVNSLGKDIYSITGGTLSVNTGLRIDAEVIKASYEVDANRNFLFTAHLKAGSVDGTAFPSGCVSLTGTISGSTSSDVVPDSALTEFYRGTRVSFTVSSARLYFTRNTTAYEQSSVEWDLYDYGRECLERLATPSYTFSVEMANFLSMQEFEAFKNSITLGNKVYLRLDDKTVIEPIAVKCVFDYEDPSKFKLEFGNTYKVTDSEFRLLDILNQSISMGSKLDVSQFSYNAWVESGAETSVSQFITSALDVAKNAILSSRGQAPTLDETGLRIRKKLDNSNEYDPRQMWAVSNSLMFTSDNWNTAELAIGEFVDDNAGTCWGIVAKTIAGTLIAGNNLIIESAKKDGGVAIFRMDANGAVLHNASFDLYASTQNNGRIALDPTLGIVGGFPSNSLLAYTNGNPSGIRAQNNSSTYTRVSQIPTPTSVSDIKLPYANFWLDMYGDLFIKGNIYAKDGIFNGTVYARDGEFTGKITATSGLFKGTVQADDFLTPGGNSMLSKNPGSAYKFDSDFLDLKGISITDTLGRNSFSVNRNGYVTIGSGSNQITYNNGVLTVSGNISMNGGSISWGSVNAPSASQVGARPDNWMPSASQVGAIPNVNNAIKSTHITAGAIQTPHLAANSVTANVLAANSVTASHILAGSIDATKMKVNQLSAISADMGTINAGTITGGTITSNSTINVTTDAHIGNNIYLGDQRDNRYNKSIYFNTGTSIDAGGNLSGSPSMSFRAPKFFFVNANEINCGGATIRDAYIDPDLLGDITAVWA